MKILFITDNFPPEVNAPASRTYEHCKRWVEKGAEVTVVTCAPNFPQGKVYEGYKNKLYQSEIVDGIKVIRVWSYISANEGFLKRIIDYTSFAFMAFWAGLFRSCDVIVATSPQFFTTFTGWALSKLKRRPWVFELRDLWPETITTVGAMKKSKAIEVFKKIEHFMYRSADMIIPVTSAFKEKLIEQNINSDKIHVVTNGVNTNLFPVMSKNQNLLLEHQLNGQFVIGYIGTHGVCQNLSFIIDSIHDIDLPNVKFLFIGDGAEKNKVVNYAQKKNIKNIIFLDSVPKNIVVEYLSLIDVALVPLQKSDTFKKVIPSKIFEAAAMQKPILHGVDGISREIIEKYQSGLYFEPENKVSFQQSLNLMISDNTLYKKMQRNGLALATDYDRNQLADKMLDHLQDLIQGNISK